MKQNDYPEPEWPEDSWERPEEPAEDEESDRGLYTNDTEGPAEAETKDRKTYPEESDFLTAEDYAFLAIDDHKIYKMKAPPEMDSEPTYYRKAEACFQIYFRTRDLYYFHGFLHYYEPTLNRAASGFMLRYAMSGHFADLKQECVVGLLEAEKRYDPAKGKTFLQFSRTYMENRMHDYARRMRTGCTVETDYAYDKLRNVMYHFNRFSARNDRETVCSVAREMNIPQAEAEELIQYALLNMLCTGMYRSYGAADGEAEENCEEITIGPYPEPYEALLQKYRSNALRTAWNALNYREREMLAAHLGFCPECFGVLERTGPSEKWYDCRPRKATPYADLAADFGLSSPESVQRICERAVRKLRTAFERCMTV